MYFVHYLNSVQKHKHNKNIGAAREEQRKQEKMMKAEKEDWCCNAFAKTQKYRNKQIMASNVSESSSCILFDV